MANQTKMVFGTPTVAISHAATLANAANTYSGLASCTMAEVDNSTDLYPLARAVLNINDTFSAAPTAGGTIDLYMWDTDAGETPAPGSADIIYNAKFVGSFVVDDQDVAIIKAIIISLEGIKKAKFAILNSTGVTISYSSVATLVTITPFTYGPS